MDEYSNLLVVKRHVVLSVVLTFGCICTSSLIYNSVLKSLVLHLESDQLETNRRLSVWNFPENLIRCNEERFLLQTLFSVLLFGWYVCLSVCLPLSLSVRTINEELTTRDSWNLLLSLKMTVSRSTVSLRIPWTVTKLLDIRLFYSAWFTHYNPVDYSLYLY